LGSEEALELAFAEEVVLLVFHLAAILLVVRVVLLVFHLAAILLVVEVVVVNLVRRP
jgi:hypothetical protein